MAAHATCPENLAKTLELEGAVEEARSSDELARPLRQRDAMGKGRGTVSERNGHSLVSLVQLGFVGVFRGYGGDLFRISLDA